LGLTGREHIKWLPGARGSNIILKITAAEAVAVAAVVRPEKATGKNQQERICRRPIAIVSPSFEI